MPGESPTAMVVFCVQWQKPTTGILLLRPNPRSLNGTLEASTKIHLCPLQDTFPTHQDSGVRTVSAQTLKPLIPMKRTTSQLSVAASRVSPLVATTAMDIAHSWNVPTKLSPKTKNIHRTPSLTLLALLLHALSVLIQECHLWNLSRRLLKKNRTRHSTKLSPQ